MINLKDKNVKRWKVKALRRYTTHKQKDRKAATAKLTSSKDSLREKAFLNIEIHYIMINASLY